MALCMVLLCGCETYDNFYKTFFEPEEEALSVVKIGLFEPFTGADAEAAAEEIKGIRLAHSLWGSVLGVDIELVEADNQSDVSHAPEAAQELIDQGVSVILGSCKSTLSLAASDVIEEGQVPAIGITCINPIITETNPYYVRVCTIDAYEGYIAALYATERLGAESVSVLKQEGDDFSDALIKAFTERMEATTGDEFCVNLVEYPEGTEDFSDYLFKASTSASGIVYFPSSPEQAMPVIRQAAEESYEFTWLGGSSWAAMDQLDPEYVRQEETYLNGVCYVAGFSMDKTAVTPTSEAFKEAYHEAYGQDQEPTVNAALGFDAYLLALEGIRKAGSASNTQLISRSLYNVFELEGASGSLSLNANGDPIKQASINMFRPGGETQVYVVSPKWGE